jgi:cell division protein FtsL
VDKDSDLTGVCLQPDLTALFGTAGGGDSYCPYIALVLVVFMTYARHSASVKPVRSRTDTNRVVSLERRRALRRQSAQFPHSQRHRDPTIVIPLRDRQQPSHESPSANPLRGQRPWLRRSLTALTVLLASSTLTVYGGTVYSQQQWHKATRELEQLRQQERQLVITTEALRQNVIALEDDRPETNLASVSEQLLYIEPAAPRDRRDPPRHSNSASRDATPTEFPLGY